MSTTVHEALLSAQLNFQTMSKMAPGLSAHPIWQIAMEQLSNALTAIDNGRDLNFVIQDGMGGEIKL